MRAEHGKLWRVMILVLLPVCLLPVTLWAEDASKDVLAPQAFVLTVHESGSRSSAREASLRAILAQIGRELAIEVVVHIPADETITVTFDHLPIVEALKSSAPITSMWWTPQGRPRMGKIIVSPRERPPHAQPQHATRGAAHRGVTPEPFTFEFDPSKAMQERK